MTHLEAPSSQEEGIIYRYLYICTSTCAQPWDSLAAMVTLTRYELYELVWAEAVSHVAKRYSLSGAGLRKICLRNDIPVPPRGHWAKVAAGQKVERPRLPRPKDAGLTIRVPNANKIDESSVPARPREEAPLVVQQKALEGDPQNRIEVRGEGKHTHPWARELKKNLKSASPNYRGLFEAGAAEHLFKVEVSEGTTSRAIGIVDAIGRAVEKRGLEIIGVRNSSYGYPRYRETRLSLEGVLFRVRIVERSRRYERPKSKLKKPASMWERDYRYEYRPTGELRLTVISEDEGWSSPERTISDRHGEPVELRLNQLMVEIAEMAAEVLDQRADREEARRRSEEARERTWALQREREAEEAKKKALEDLAERHNRAVRLRELIEAVEASGTVPGPPGAPQGLSEWLEWARAHANSIGPLSLRSNEE